MSTLKEVKMREITITKAISEAIDEEMARDSTVFLMGEDIGGEGTWVSLPVYLINMGPKGC